ncbi:family 78 glycoside hydrolase catalytic domain [Thalassotalea litorea]|uniref:family 78 glycoside hydrolase catalytic domain n=1 Tax=Thalassotalea litorea TaxID=2020715 RepID=UPI0037368AEB
MNLTRLPSVLLLLALLNVTMLLQGCQSDDAPLLGKAPVELSVGEGVTNPLGYYESEPRFSWQLANDAIGNFQSAYQIQLSTQNPEFSKANVYWDSGKVDSERNSWVRYSGSILRSRDKVFWRVRIWDDKQRVSNWSQVQSMELGLLNNSDWQAQWIGHPDTAIEKQPEQALLAKAQYLRTEFNLSENVKKARLYVSAKGLFKAYLNGSEIAPEDVMTPGWTPYQKRIETLTYDVTDMLAKGRNVIAGNIAGGWYAGRVYKFKDKEHRLPARFIAQLEIEFESGQTKIIASDQNWLSFVDGPIQFASIYDGEHYYQAREIDGWTQPSFTPDGWQQVVTAAIRDEVKLVPKQHAPVRVIESLTKPAIVAVENGKVIYDFGQNMVGVPQIQLPVKAGQTVQLRFAEALHKGEFYTDNYRSAESTVFYHPNKDGIVSYRPRFTYFGYRYIEITGYDPEFIPSEDWLSALVQHSDVTINADFATSQPKLNKLAENIVWGLRSNFFDIPLDCPQRDERLGWTGDAQVFAMSSMYMADVYGFWSAWLRSVREEQSEDGMIPLYIPFVEWINWASSGWGDAVTIIPWDLYVATGDASVLADNYPMMLSWLDYHESQSRDYVSHMKTFGDWLQPYPEATNKNANRGDTDFQLISTAFYAHSVALTLKAAQVLDKNKDAERLQALLGNLKSSFQSHFFDEHLNLTDSQATQTAYLLGLAFDLFAESQRGTAENKLIALIDEADVHLRTGFLGTPLLAEVLQNAGRSDLVYQLLFKESYPSWFYSINNGATTTWERWNSYSLADGFNPEGMNSLNHYAYGSISRWFYEGILGIKPAAPGFKRILIEPQLNEKLTSASGSYHTPQGKVSVQWSVNEERFTLVLKVPKNTQAEVKLPTVTLSNVSAEDGAVNNVDLSTLSPGQYVIEGTLKPEFTNSMARLNAVNSDLITQKVGN